VIFELLYLDASVDEAIRRFLKACPD